MTKRMLIDAAHPEETRVVVMDGHRVDEFDLEAANRLPLKGNIYLARVVRVEPSLQAAFVEYGGNRHGFLAFGEIHPDYYQIPVADRQRLIEAQEAEAREEAEAEARDDERRAQAQAARAAAQAARAAEVAAGDAEPAEEPPLEALPQELTSEQPTPEEMEADIVAQLESQGRPESAEASEGDDENGSRVEILPPSDAPPPETIGESEGDAEGEAEAEQEEERRERRSSPRFLRNYKIQEVIRRRQILLIQVVKEERGTKGAALTTYISLAGRFSVLMPNSPRGGGVSRKITSSSDRRRLREVIDELEMPHGMSLIVRTAGAQRPKPEIRRDCEYLLRLWDDIRERTLASTAPALIYEEADLIKRSIRDGYARDMDEIIVEGDTAYAQAREFMRMLMPEHARKIQAYRDGTVPLFSRFQAEAQLDAMHEPNCQLRSGGYLVINQTEALVAIDVNSGRSTRERSIEDTALRTNLEAADEVARQLRLRDLAGLIVIDFIDMDSNRHNAMVEKRLKDALRTDRARIQVGRISHFGLLELSRQRLRPSLAETTFVTCPHCLGRGTVRGLESSALAVLRAVEEECAKRRAAEITVRVTSAAALYLLNKKRDRLADIENRWGVTVLFDPDDTLHGAETRIERSKAPPPPIEDSRPAALRMDYAAEEEAAAEEVEEAEAAEASDASEAGMTEEERARRPRRRRRGRGRREGGPERGEGAEDGVEAPAEGASEAEAGAEDAAPAEVDAEAEPAESPMEGAVESPVESEESARRRRGRRGGRRRREGEAPAAEREAPEAPAAFVAPAPAGYAGPTPADPFANTTDSLMAAMEAAEAAAEAALVARPAAPAEPAPLESASVESAPAESAPAPAADAVPEVEPIEAAPLAAVEPVAAEPVEPKPEPIPEPVGGASPPKAEPEPAAEVVIGPAIQPKTVEEVAAAAPRRGGWWKR
ncbi:ribonuclease E/G [Roseococcus sp. SYP-B2431]|uniref:Rne/Rng family ribonuclease n=1 Tax=Roseococcus sp. SYP-B2431 TaxID=2496640 RepID=UPI001040648E|nr:ribonuclease E/G [Roseococcus sp. SYP-B2431]TCI00972.1 ribonuclease E/G [Roseococcus sp. SYP-B2431]